MTATPSPIDQMTSHLSDLFEPDNLIELRLLGKGKKTQQHFRTLAQILNKQEELFKWLTKQNKTGYNVFYGANPRSQERGTDEDVPLARILFVDFDDISTTSGAIERVSDANLPYPTLIVKSGRGVHMYWRLENPIEDMEEWSNRQKALILAVNSDRTIHNPSRLMRLPGFLNVNHNPLTNCETYDRRPENVWPIDEFHDFDQSKWASNGQPVFVGRNDYLYRYGCAIRSEGRDGEDLFSDIAGRNQSKFSDDPLDDHELRTIWGSVLTQPRGEITKSRSDDVALSEIPEEEIHWLWPYRIPLGKLTILAGMQGLGKSFVTQDMACRISAGGVWPDIPSPSIKPGRVLILSQEDSPADTIRPRIRRMGGNLESIRILRGIKDAGSDKSRLVDFARDIEVLDKRLFELGDVRLIIIDPLPAYLGNRLDIHRDNEVRLALDPIVKLAEKHDVAILAVMHVRKAQSDFAIFKVLGSVAFTALARTTWMIAHDPDDPKEGRLLMSGKMSFAKAAPSRKFRIVDPGLVEWGEGSELTADEVLMVAPNADPDTTISKVEEARDFLTMEISTEAKKSKEVESRALAMGIAIRTLRRARKDLDLEPYLVGGVGSSWWIGPLGTKGGLPR